MLELAINSGNFEEEVINSTTPVLLDFWANWCGPCQMLAPLLAELAKKYEGKLKIAKVNIDEEAELADAFNVSSIPMLVLVKDGKADKVLIGYRPIEEIEEYFGFGK